MHAYTSHRYTFSSYMNQMISLYYFLEKPLSKMIRLVLFLGIIGLVTYAVLTTQFLKAALILCTLTVISEIFIRYKLAHVSPSKTVKEADSDIKNAATMPVLGAYEGKTTHDMLSFLTHQEEIRFFLSRMLVSNDELQIIDIDKTQLIEKANDLATATHTMYIDTPHLFGAYLLLSDPETKLLFHKKLKADDVLRLIVWTSLTYPKRQEKPRHFQVIGEGYGETLTTGWTYETSKYTIDWTTEALINEPLLFGLHDIFTQIIGVLSQPTHNNVLLIGEPGSGKHALIDKLAFESYNGHVPHNLQHKRILALMTGALLAGMQNQSDLQTRLQLILAELAHADVIISIPQLQDILGSSSFNIDLSDTLLPYLEHGTIPLIATTTPQNYKKYVEHSSLAEFFTPITLTEPNEETLFGMLCLSTTMLERKQNILISYLAIIKAIELAPKFVQNSVLPGSAVKLLEAVATHLLSLGKQIVTDEDIASYVETTNHIPVSEPKGEEKNVLIHLEEILHQKVIGQDEAIKKVSQSMRRLREGLGSSKKPISFLFLGPTGVGKTETAKALADVYYAGQSHMLRFDMSEYNSFDGVAKLLGSAPGFGEEKGLLTEKVYDHPSSLILLDEFEKAHPAILDLFLQVLDDGRLTDSKGKTVSFANCIIIATSNAGSEFIREQITEGMSVDKQFQDSLLHFLQQNHLFKPELLNRFDDVIVFTPLNHTEVLTITSMLLQNLVNTLSDQDITITITPEVVEKIANESYDASLGARPIQRYIQDTVEDLIAKEKLKDALPRGSKAILTLNQQGTISLLSQ